MTDCVSIILPIIRPEKANRCVDNIIENAGSVIFEIVSEYDAKRIGAPKMVRHLVEKSKYNMVCFLGDDTIPQSGFLESAMVAMKTLPDGWGLVGLNDMTGRNLACHWLAHKNLLPLVGGEFFHTGYRHCFCDNELQERSEKLGRYVYAKGAIVEHDHPILKGQPVTGDYARAYSQDNYIHDQMLFNQRRSQWLTQATAQ